MRKITVNNLKELSDSEAGVVTGFFQAKLGRKASLIKAAAIAGFFGVTLVMNEILDGLIKEHPELHDIWLLEYFPHFQLGFSILQLLIVGFLLTYCIKLHADTIIAQGKLDSIGIDVTAINDDDVFTHLLLPRLKDAGVNVVD